MHWRAPPTRTGDKPPQPQRIPGHPTAWTHSPPLSATPVGCSFFILPPKHPTPSQVGGWGAVNARVLSSLVSRHSLSSVRFAPVGSHTTWKVNNQRELACVPLEEVTEEQPGLPPPRPRPREMLAEPLPGPVSGAALEPHSLGGSRCHPDPQAASGHRPCLQFGASSKRTPVLPAAGLAAQPILQLGARAGSPDEPLEVPVSADSPSLRPPTRGSHCLWCGQTPPELGREQPSFQKTRSQEGPAGSRCLLLSGLGPWGSWLSAN